MCQGPASVATIGLRRRQAGFRVRSPERLGKLREVNRETPVIVLTAKGGIDSAVEAMRAGASDFLVKPASPERIKVSIQNALKLGVLSGEVTRLKKKAQNTLVFDDMIAKSPGMKQVLRIGQRAGDVLAMLEDVVEFGAHHFVGEIGLFVDLGGGDELGSVAPQCPRTLPAQESHGLLKERVLVCGHQRREGVL